jgi:hypothetical protein
MFFFSLPLNVASAAVKGRRALDIGGQATKGVWGMSRHQKAMKGVEDCEKPGVFVKLNSIPGFPNELVLNT